MPSGLLRHYVAAGEGPGSHIAICLERSIEMVAGLLGILHLGAAYVPMDPNYPTQRLSLMIEDAGVSTVLTSRRMAARLPTSVRHIFIEDALLAPTGVRKPLRGDPESLCYVIYTSGSTGTPKGVCVSHRALANVLHSMSREPGLTAHDKLLAVTSLTFDIAAVELFLPLIRGAGCHRKQRRGIRRGKAAGTHSAPRDHNTPGDALHLALADRGGLEPRNGTDSGLVWRRSAHR